jgi:hypothetical protein
MNKDAIKIATITEAMAEALKDKEIFVSGKRDFEELKEDIQPYADILYDEYNKFLNIGYRQNGLFIPDVAKKIAPETFMKLAERTPNQAIGFYPWRTKIKEALRNWFQGKISKIDYKEVAVTLHFLTVGFLNVLERNNDSLTDNMRQIELVHEFYPNSISQAQKYGRMNLLKNSAENIWPTTIVEQKANSHSRKNGK